MFPQTIEHFELFLESENRIIHVDFLQMFDKL